MSDNANDALVMFFKVVAVVVFVYPFLHYTVLNRGEHVQQADNQTEPNNETEQVKTSCNKPVVVVQQPTCHISYLLVVLQDLCNDLYVRHEQCTPEDFHDLEKHKLPKSHARSNTTGEPRGTIVGCVAAGLLLTSLGAAFFELYKAKSHTPVKNTKPMISRKCSLADLTVLKHNRKELVRRESIMEIPETGGSLKPLGFRPPPLYRRCSFPVGPSEMTSGNSYSTYQESRRPSIESRRMSIIDSRRGSVSVDCRNASIDCRKASIDCRKASIDTRRISIDNESPERRHWSRLVHRH